MKPMFIYLAEVLFCSGLLLGVYRLLIHGRLSFGVCRSYLIAAMVAAAVIPALRIPVYPAPIVAHAALHAEVLSDSAESIALAAIIPSTLPASEAEVTSRVDWSVLLLIIYI